MAKVHIGHNGKIITYGGVLPRVCCDSTTNDEHTPSCRTRRAERQQARSFFARLFAR